MKKIYTFYSFLALLFLINTPLLADHLSPSLQFTARMNGANEVPAVATDAEGLGIFTVSPDRRNMSINISVSNLSGPITGIHIHEGVAGENGPVVHNLTDFVNGNRVVTTLSGLDDLDKFLTGIYYLNVHTDANPGGEIRAQIILESDFRYSTALSGDEEVPAVMTDAYGLAVFNLSKSGYKLQIKAVVTGLSGPITGAHLHEGAAGTNGGVVENLTANVVGNVITATVDPTDYLAALRGGLIYLNVHTAANPGGEIRGQVILEEGLLFDSFLDGGQEVPGVMTTAEGVAKINVDETFNLISYDIVVDGLSGPITGAHFHNGEFGENGGVLINLTDNIDGNRITGIVNDPNGAFINQMLAGGIYLNIHTDANLGGEIRGQVYKLAREGYSYDFGGGFEVPPTTSTGTGAGMVSIDRDQSNAHFMMVVSGLADPIDAAHFHNARPGQNGGVIYNLTPFVNAVGGAYGYWTEQDATTPFANSLMFRNNAVYANIHTATFPSGAIRGNVTRGREGFGNIPRDPGFMSDLVFATRMTGGNEVPAVTTDAMGVASLILTNDFSKINVSVNNLTGPIIGAHLHTGAADENGPVVLDLTPFVVGNRIQADLSDDIDDIIFTDMVEGNVYINVHTEMFPSGEIRGQLLLETDPTYRADLDGSQEVPAVTTDAVGLATFNYTKVVNQLEVNVLVRGLSGPIMGAHLHTGAVGENGPVVENLTDFVRGNVIRTVVMPGDYLADLQAGNVYLNIHTADNPGGEIRGQLILDKNLTFDLWLNGEQEVPVATNSAIGFAALSLTPNFETINYRVLMSGLSGEVAAAHIHEGAIGEAGGVLVPLMGIDGNEIAGSIDAIDISEELLDALFAANAYINVHTAGYPSGEIRGQVIRLARDGYSYDLCPEQETDAVDAPDATGAALTSIDRNQSNVHLMFVTSGLTGDITGAHIHEAETGEAGPVIVGLTDLVENGAAFAYLSGEDFNEAISQTIKSGNAYLNIHTELHPAGEVRGQIVKDLTCDLPVATGSVDSPFAELMISPVPANEFINVNFSTKEFAGSEVQVSVFDLMGRQVYSYQIQNAFVGENTFQINVNDFAAGMYQVVLENGGAAIVEKFVKQ